MYMEKVVKRHLRTEIQLPLAALTMVSCLYCIGSESASVVLVSFIFALAGIYVLAKYSK